MNIVKLPNWSRKPKHSKPVVASDKGWIDAETGEILKRVNNLRERLDELIPMVDSEVNETVKYFETVMDELDHKGDDSEKWDNRELGASEEHARPVDPETKEEVDGLIDQATEEQQGETEQPVSEDVEKKEEINTTTETEETPTSSKQTTSTKGQGKGRGKRKGKPGPKPKKTNEADKE